MTVAAKIIGKKIIAQLGVRGVAADLSPDDRAYLDGVLAGVGADAVQTSADRLAASGYRTDAQTDLAAMQILFSGFLAGTTFYLNEAAGRAATTGTNTFWVQPATENDPLILYRRIDGSTPATPVWKVSAFVDVDAVSNRLTNVEKVTAGFARPTGSPDGIIPLPPLFKHPTDPKKKRAFHWLVLQADGTFKYVSQATIRLDALERGGIPGGAMAPGGTGRRRLAKTGILVECTRTDDGLTQTTPAPVKRLRARQRADGHIEIGGGGLAAPFVITGESSSVPGGAPANTIWPPVHNGFEAVHWTEYPGGADKEFFFTSGFQKNTLKSGTTRLIDVQCFSQSTGIGIQGRPHLTATSPKPNRIFMHGITTDNSTARGVRGLGHGQDAVFRNEPVERERLRLLVEAHESSEGAAGETQLSMLAYECLQRTASTDAMKINAFGIGAQGFDQLKIGTVPGSNVQASFRQSWRICKMNGLSWLPVLFYPGQEASVTDSYDTFLNNRLKALHDSFASWISLMTFGEVNDVIIVTNGFTNATGEGFDHSEQALAQIDFALDPANAARVAYASPCFVFQRDPTDGVHYINTAAALNGAYAGRALGNLLNGIDCKPLYVTAANVSGNTITCDVHLPHGAAGLTKVSSIVDDPGLLGFTLHRADNNAAVPLVSADVVGNQIVVVVDPSRPSATLCNLDSGLWGTPGAHGGPKSVGSAKCPVNDGNTDLSFYNQPMANYLAPRRMQVTFS